MIDSTNCVGILFETIFVLKVGEEAILAFLSQRVGPSALQHCSPVPAKPCRSQINTRLSWADLLEYELEIRKHACKRVNQGKSSMADALTRDQRQRAPY